MPPWHRAVVLPRRPGHTWSMTSTTIKVSAPLRDALKRQARVHHRTLGEHLQHLVDQEARKDRFRRLADAMATTPPDEEYLAAADEWQSDAWS